MELKLVIFDMDGLMYDTEKLGMECLSRVAKKYGYIIDEEFGLSTIGMNAGDYHELIIDKFGNDYPFKQISQESRQMRMEHLHKHGIIVKPGLQELLAYLKQMKIKVALASSSSLATINEYNHLAGFDDVFDYMLAGNMVVHSKPDPEIFLKVLEHFGLHQNEALILEDSKNGILAGSRAHIPVICVPDLVEHDETITKLTEATVSSLFVVKEIIEEKIEGKGC